MLNEIQVVAWPNGKFDFRIIATENGNILCASHQGYENEDECIATARRVTTNKTEPRLTFTQG